MKKKLKELAETIKDYVRDTIDLINWDDFWTGWNAAAAVTMTLMAIGHAFAEARNKRTGA